MVVLARAPVLREFEIQQSQETRDGERLEATNCRATGLLDRGHAGNVEDYPKGDLPDASRYLYSGSGQMNPRLAGGDRPAEIGFQHRGVDGVKAHKRKRHRGACQPSHRVSSLTQRSASRRSGFIACFQELIVVWQR